MFIFSRICHSFNIKFKLNNSSLFFDWFLIFHIKYTYFHKNKRCRIWCESIIFSSKNLQMCFSLISNSKSYEIAVVFWSPVYQLFKMNSYSSGGRLGCLESTDKISRRFDNYVEGENDFGLNSKNFTMKLWRISGFIVSFRRKIK